MTDNDLHMLFYDWAQWVRSKRLYAPSPNPQSIIGSLVRLPGGNERNARLDTTLAALHMAVSGADESHKALVCCYYLGGQRVSKYRRGRVPVKTIAHAMGVSRKTFYARLLEVRRAIWVRVRTDELAVAE
ncbi:MAG: hypothetical protein NUV51_09700 [Sulfuricaulis sp.]|nr:hypothetical protein [Sulfuricaulis sp.]